MSSYIESELTKPEYERFISLKCEYSTEGLIIRANDLDFLYAVICRLACELSELKKED